MPGGFLLRYIGVNRRYESDKHQIHRSVLDTLRYRYIHSLLVLSESCMMSSLRHTRQFRVTSVGCLHLPTANGIL